MKYYVYELVNSLDGKTFYVGKGKDRRMFIHEHRARRGHAEKGENPKLRNKIKSIWTKGGMVIHKQIFSTDSDVQAYEKEIERIKELGLQNLCNLRIYQMTPEEAYQRASQKMLGHHTSVETREKIRKTLSGHRVSTETRQKMRIKKLGKKNPCAESKRLSIALSRRPENGFPQMKSPTGEVHIINILTDFCNQHGLRLSSISDVIHKRRKSHRGWRIADKHADA